MNKSWDVFDGRLLCFCDVRIMNKSFQWFVKLLYSNSQLPKSTFLDGLYLVTCPHDLHMSVSTNKYMYDLSLHNYDKHTNTTTKYDVLSKQHFDEKICIIVRQCGMRCY